MKHFHWQIALGLSLIALSALVYAVHYFIFRDSHHIFIYMVGDLAFVFVEVLLVTLIIHRLLGERERRARLQKLNMVIGVFYSEMGTKLLAYFSDLDPNLGEIRSELCPGDQCTELDFARISRRLGDYGYSVRLDGIDMDGLRQFLLSKRGFLLNLLQNPNLLEHETFTNLLRGVFHLTEELENRHQFEGLPATDTAHLAGDIQRSYVLLVQEWWAYMKYLRAEYPYLYSLAVRTNPFDAEATPIIS